MKQYYKVLDDDGRSCSGGNFQWSLPTQDSDGNWIPGEWHEHDGYVLLCVSGFHLTDNPYAWSDNNTVTYECEIADDAIQSEYENIGFKIAVSKVRLTKLFTGSLYYVGKCEEQHFVDGKLHRDNDLPAVICVNGNQYWYQNGLKHRDNDLPAIVYNDGGGGQKWYQNGKLHRGNDLPAVVRAGGDQYWYQNGECHRDNDLPAVVYSDGGQCWYKDGELHRDNDQPAVIWDDGRREFWINGIKQ